jgi:protein involved in polysaccharide export with SLBB domain
MNRKLFLLFITALGVFCSATSQAQVSGSLNSARLTGDELASGRMIVPVINGSEDSSDAKNTPAPTKSRKDSTSGTRKPTGKTIEVVSKPVVLPESDRTLSAKIYKVSSNDVLDVRLAGIETRESTLFTVSPEGNLDYPLADEPIPVVGLTPEEIGPRIASRIKIYEKAKVNVSVREFASHFVIVTGAVANPGSKSLRRESVPLYVLLSEAEPRSDAISATIIRRGRPDVDVNLGSQDALSTLVSSGDVIKVNTPPVKAVAFFYISGEINSPGQKDFYEGMTLSQAVLVAGGPKAGEVHRARVFHRMADGRLTSVEYDLTLIDQGKSADPELRAGDRIELFR